MNKIEYRYKVVKEKLSFKNFFRKRDFILKENLVNMGQAVKGKEPHLDNWAKEIPNKQDGYIGLLEERVKTLEKWNVGFLNRLERLERKLIDKGVIK